MKTITREKQIEAVSGWWNSDKITKYDKQYDDWDANVIHYRNSRLEKVLEFVDELKLPKGSKVLELGYGAGQTSLRLGQRGFEVHGVDTSKKFHEIATRRCQRGCPEGKFFLTTGNIESGLEYEGETFDLVVIIGALHYLYNDDACLKEVFRVLKLNGHLIIDQRKAYGLAHFTSIRTFLRSCVYFILREEYELFPSFKSLLCDSKLGVIFDRFQDSRFLNSKFLLKGHDVWRYKLKKRLYSHRSLMSLCRRTGFIPLRSDGACYCVFDEPKYNELNLKVGRLLQRLSKIRFLHFISRLGETTVVLNKKRR